MRRSYLRYLRMASASSAADRGMTLPVRLKLIDEDAYTHEGKIDFVDNAIDRSSGTIRGRAQFANADGRLTPGMFGRIQIATSAPAEALLVPDTRHRHRAGAQVRLRARTPITWRRRST